MKPILATCALVLTLIASGCDSNSSSDLNATLDQAQGQHGLAGAVSGTDALIGLLITETNAMVYVCSTDDEISEWFNAAVADRTDFTLSNSDGASVTATFENGTMSGRLTLRTGSQHTFSASSVGSGEGGIYRIDDAAAAAQDIEGGWVVDADGTERGAFRIGTTFRAAPKRPKLPTDGRGRTKNCQ